MMILKGSLLLLLAGLLCEGLAWNDLSQKWEKMTGIWFVFSIMANTMSYFDLVGDDCMEMIMETSVDQLEERIDSAVKKLRKYAKEQYKEKTKVKKNKFSMSRFKLAIACQVLKTA